MKIQLHHHERKGWWKAVRSDHWAYRAKAHARINDREALVLFDTGAEISLISSSFAHKLGLEVDPAQAEICEGVGGVEYRTEGSCVVKLTLANELVYEITLLVGPMMGQDMILGLDFMSRAGARVDAADGSVCLPGDVLVPFEGRKQLFSAHARPIFPRSTEPIAVGGYRDVAVGKASDQVLWICRQKTWVTTIMRSRSGIPRWIRVTNVTDRPVMLKTYDQVGVWMSKGLVPRKPGFVFDGARRSREWQNLAFSHTTDEWVEDLDKLTDRYDGPAVDRPVYPTPRSILKRDPTLPQPDPREMSTDPSVRQRDPANVGDGSECGSTMTQLLSRVEVSTDLRVPSPDLGDPSEGSATPTVRSSDPSKRSSDPSGHYAYPHETSGGSAARFVAGGSAKPIKVVRFMDEDQTDSKTRHQILQVATVSELEVDQQGADDEVVIHEGEDPLLEDIEANFAVIPDVPVKSGIDPSTSLKKEDLKVGDSSTDKHDRDRLRDLIWERMQILMGKGDATPPAARGVICDIDVGSAKPVAQSVRKVRPEYLEKLFILIKALLANGLIRPSKSRWASPIVIVKKKNGEIRLCIDYRIVNALTMLMVYPMPLVSDLLEELHGMMWFCSLDMASGFWVVPMTDRARLISAFITPFGLFEWLRMPFGLKNAPQIYQRIVDNVVYNTFRLSNNGGSEHYDVFQDGEVADPQSGSLMGRRSYIDDFLIPARSWDELCDRVGKFLDACAYWNLSISVEKSVWGMSAVEYLGHKIDRVGIRPNLKDPVGLTNLEFPATVRAMQSFLGSVNYFSRFIDDYATIAAAMYEWKPDSTADAVERRRIDAHARKSFELLKDRILDPPTLRHFDPAREIVIAVCGTGWSISGALLQKYDDEYDPVRFTSRVLKKHERNYSDGEKEILALLRVLDVCYNMLAGRKIYVWTCCSTLSWLWKTKGLQGRLATWAAMLSCWTMEIRRGVEKIHGFLGVVAAGSAPKDRMNEVLEDIAPISIRVNRSRIPAPIPTLDPAAHTIVGSFDGSARSKRNGGSCSAILWKFPEWTVIAAKSRYFEDITVNEAEYQGILLALELARSLDCKDLVICGDSKLVIQQLRQEMDCKAPGLQLLWKDASREIQSFRSCQLVHVKRDWNASADLLASRALQAQNGIQSVDESTRTDLERANRLDEVILTKDLPPVGAAIGGSGNEFDQSNGVITDPEGRDAVSELRDESGERIPQIHAVRTRRQVRRQQADPSVIGNLRIERIRTAQDEEQWICDLKRFLNGDLADIDNRTVHQCARIADLFEIDEDDVLYYMTGSKRGNDGSDDVDVRLVIPSTLIDDVLHHYHTSLEGGHQGVSRTYAKIRRFCYWRSMYKDIQNYVASCVDCQTGKGRPWIRGPSPGNVKATYPFQMIAMDHIPSMPVSHRGNTELLLWVDLFSGYVIAKANTGRTAPIVAESYEECVFRRFGASECIRHDREPGFMAEFFEAFNKLIGQRQRATMAYRPQANGSAERMVQTLTRAMRMYVEDEGQRDWDDYAERLVFALNTSHDRVRDDTPFYLIHGWDPRTTLESTLLCGSSQIRDQDPRRWRFRIQRHYMYARRQAESLVRDAQAERADRANEAVNEHPITVGSRVWLYIERVREGLARKLAHKWHGPFRVKEIRDQFMVKLDLDGSGYRLSSWVHISRLKPCRDAPVRPQQSVTVDSDQRFDFDEALLPEDSFDPDPDAGVYEVEKLLERRVIQPRTRQGRSYIEFLVKWKGYDETSWIREVDLNCGGLIYDFNQRERALNRFQMMQTSDDPSPE